MKKNFFSIVAIAILAAAFTGKGKKSDLYYWFQFDQVSQSLQPIHWTVPPTSSSPVYCSGSYDLTCAEAYRPQDTETFSMGGTTYRRKKTGPGILFQIRLFKEDN